MIPFTKKVLPLAVFTLTLGACGGGGGGGESLAAVDISPAGGISGSGITVTGTVDGFGSIFVNGVEYETDDAEFSIDGQNGDEDDLDIGMVVIVQGTLNEDGVTGTAERVIFDDEVEGPISDIQPGGDNDSKLITILGIEVIVERTGTVFEHVNFDTLAIDDVVEVSGFPEPGNLFRATRVEKKADFVAGQTEVEVKGSIENLSDTEFTLGDFIVDFSNADLSGVESGTLSNGLLVEVYGTVSENTILASRGESEDSITDLIDDEEDFSILGAISDFSDISSFSISGISIDGSDATLIPAGLSLVNGVVVEAEGVWNGSVLLARSIEARRGRVEIEATVDSVDSASGTIILRLYGGAVTVQADARTLLDDDTGSVSVLTLDDIRAGDFLEVEAIVDDTDLIATRIDLEERDDDVVQAPVESFIAGSQITLLGITYSTNGAEFEDLSGNPITADDFYGQLQPGDLVKVNDELTADGVADEVEFEFEDRPDGGHEFDDDSAEDSEEEDSEEEDSEEEDSEEEGSEEEDSEEEGSEEEDSEEEDSEEEGSEEESSEEEGSEEESSEEESSEEEGSEEESSEEESSEEESSEEESSEEEGSDGEEPEGEEHEEEETEGSN